MITTKDIELALSSSDLSRETVKRLRNSVFKTFGIVMLECDSIFMFIENEQLIEMKPLWIYEDDWVFYSTVLESESCYVIRISTKIGRIPLDSIKYKNELIEFLSNPKNLKRINIKIDRLDTYAYDQYTYYRDGEEVIDPSYVFEFVYHDIDRG